MFASTRYILLLPSLLLLLCGCRDLIDLPTETYPSIDVLQGTSWTLTAAEPPLNVNLAQTHATAIFESYLLPSGSYKLTGYTGCNEYFGAYTHVNDGTLRISTLGATRRACDSRTAHVEEAMLLNLPKAESFILDGKNLIIRCAEGITFRFRNTTS